MQCTDNEWKHCRVEKMGCDGCYYSEKEDKLDEQKISKHTKNKSNKTN